MNRLFAKYFGLSPAIHFYSLLLFTFFFPLWSPVAILAIIVMLLNTICSGWVSNNLRNLLHPLPLSSILLYFIYLLGLTYTDDMVEGLRDIESKLSFLVFPVILFTAPVVDRIKRSKVFLAFVIACIITIFKGIFLYYYYLPSYNAENLFFANLTGIHSSYFCLYLGVCIYFLSDEISNGEIRLSSGRKRWYYLLILFFVATIYFLKAKMGFLILVLLFSVFYSRYKINQREIKDGIIRLVLALITVWTFAWVIPQTRYLLFAKINVPGATMEKDAQPDVRITIWSSALEAIRQSPVYGYGTGDIKQELTKIYERRNFELGLRKNFNPHNQYLQTGVALGVIGILVLLTHFLIALLIAIKRRHYFFLFLLLSIAMGCLTESMLETEKGILFYFFFYCLLGRETLEAKKELT